MSKDIACLKSRANGVKRGSGLTFGVQSRKIERKKNVAKSCDGLYSPCSVFFKTFKRTVTITIELHIDDLVLQSSLTSWHPCCSVTKEVTKFGDCSVLFAHLPWYLASAKVTIAAKADEPKTVVPCQHCSLWPRFCCGRHWWHPLGAVGLWEVGYISVFWGKNSKARNRGGAYFEILRYISCATLINILLPTHLYLA